MTTRACYIYMVFSCDKKMSFTFNHSAKVLIWAGIKNDNPTNKFSCDKK